MTITLRTFDVVIIGAGNAGLAAAVSARQNGATVCVLERSTRAARGGNSSLTRNIRFPHAGGRTLFKLVPGITTKQRDILLDFCRDPYSEDAMIEDWLRISGRNTSRDLVELVVRAGAETINWMHRIGHQWTVARNPLPGALQLHLLDGGTRLQTTWFNVADKLGASIIYYACVSNLEPPNAEHSWRIRTSTGYTIEAGAVVIAAGGFQANAELRTRELGSPWADVNLRGTALNDGTVTLRALDIGAQKAGNWSGCHAVPYATKDSLRHPPNNAQEAQDATRYAYPFGIMVNHQGKRFIDEASDFGNMTYARMGHSIITQPRGEVFQIFGSAAINKLPPQYFEDSSSRQGNSIAALAHSLGISATPLVEELSSVNALLVDLAEGRPPHTTPATPRTPNIPPLDPPYFGIPVGTGLTFTFGGLKINNRCQVLDSHGSAVTRLYACGEVVGGLYHDNYPGGVGLLAGAVMGRIAGSQASRTSSGL